MALSESQRAILADKARALAKQIDESPDLHTWSKDRLIEASILMLQLADALG